MFKKWIFTKLADSFTDPSRFLEIRFFTNLLAEISNLRETCQQIKET